MAASAAIPLRGLLSQRRLSGAWRLKEATAGVVEADRLDLGRATVQLAWCGLFCVREAAGAWLCVCGHGSTAWDPRPTPKAHSVFLSVLG